MSELPTNGGATPDEGENDRHHPVDKLILAAFAGANAPILIVDCRTRRIVVANGKAARLLGYSETELQTIALSGIQVEPPEVTCDGTDEVSPSEGGLQYRTAWRTKDGLDWPVEVSTSVMYQGHSRLLVMVAQAISRVGKQESSGDSETWYRDLYEEAPIAYFTVGADGRIRRANRRAAELLECGVEDIVGRRVIDLYTESPEGKQKAQRLFQRFLDGEALRNEELEMRKEDGESLWVSLTVRPVFDAEGRVIESRSMAVDITDRKRAEQRIQHMAFYDLLTELPNRRFLYTYLDDALSDAQRGGHRLAVLYLDLDHFKAVNDMQGHATGDLLLQAVARQLRSAVRESDIVARLGGDEFLVVLPRIDGLDQAIEAAKRILSELEQPLTIEGSEVETSASIGVSLFPDHGGNAEVLLRNADTAMYQAKAAGRKAYAVFSASEEMSGSRRDVSYPTRQPSRAETANNPPNPS